MSQGGLFGGMNNQQGQQSQQQSGLFGQQQGASSFQPGLNNNQQQQQQQQPTTGGLFGSGQANQQQGQANSLFGGSNTNAAGTNNQIGGGMFGNTNKPDAAKNIFGQGIGQQGGAVGSQPFAQQGQASNQQISAFGASGQQGQSSSLSFGNQGGNNQQASTTTTQNGIFGNQNTPNPAAQTQAQLFSTAQNQQQNQQGQQQQQQPQQQQPSQQQQQTPSQPTQQNMFTGLATGAGAGAGTTGMFANAPQPQQQTPTLGKSLFGGATGAQGQNNSQPPATGGLFGQATQNQPAGQKASNLGGMFGNNTQPTQNTNVPATSEKTAPQGQISMFGNNSNNNPQVQGQQQQQQNQDELQQQQTQQQPQQQQKQPAQQQQASNNLFGGAINDKTNAGQAAKVGGGLFANNGASQQPAAGQQPVAGQQANVNQNQAQQPKGLFNMMNNNPQATTNQPAQTTGNTNTKAPDQSNPNPTTSLFSNSVLIEQPKLNNRPALGNLAKQGENQASNQVNQPNQNNPATQQAQQPSQQGGNANPTIAQNTTNTQQNQPASNTGNQAPTTATTTTTAQGGLFTQQKTTPTPVGATGGAIGGIKPISTNAPPTEGPLLNLGAGAPSSTAGATKITGAGVTMPIPTARKNHQQVSHVTGPDERLNMDIDSAKKLNGTLHMFCQNIHKYKPDHVKKFFENADILNKLKQGLQIYKTEQNTDQWENIKKEAKEGKSPLKFWCERLSKYKYQYLIVMIIEELADYLQIKQIDCYYFFDVFLSHESKFVDFFFDPSSNEPCIEFFYEQQALTYESNNVGIRKDSPFIINLKTSFMKDIYFHERNCILASLRLLLLMSEDQENYEVVKGVLDSLFRGENTLEKSLWEQYTKPQANAQLSAEDNELFQLQQQFESDQIIKLLFIINNRGYSKTNILEYLNFFIDQSFMGNWEKLQPQNENSFENKNKINELSTVIGDSCLMLILSKEKELNQYKGSSPDKGDRDPISNILKSAKNNSQQIQVLFLYYTIVVKQSRINSFDQIEYLYKLISRTLSYKNLGILKSLWQEIFFNMIMKIIDKIYDSDLQEVDQYQESIICECLSRAISKSIYKNTHLINLLWKKFESQKFTEQFKNCFKSPTALYKIMKSAMGVSSEPKARYVILFLTTIEHFNWFKFNQKIELQVLDESHILRLRLMYKLIVVDPKCIDLIQFVFNYPTIDSYSFEQYFTDCQGEEVIKFVIRSFALYNDYRSSAYQNFFFGLKALNSLLNNHQYQTQQILQIEEYQELFTKEYRRLAIQNDVNSTEYRIKCKREVLNILYTILKDFEEPLLAFSQIKGMERNTEYDSPLLLHLFIFFANFIEDWEQNQGVINLKHKWKIGSLIMKITDICLNRLSVNVYKKNDFRPGQSDSYTSFFLNSFLCSQLKKIRVDEMIIKILEVSANSSSISK